MRSLLQLSIASLIFAPTIAAAHFPYLNVADVDGQATLSAHFGHGAEPTQEKHFPRLVGAKVWKLQRGERPESIQLKRGSDSLVAMISPSGPAVYGFEKNQGVVEYNGIYLLTNYSKAFTGQGAWAIDTSKHLKLDIAPELKGDQLGLTVRWNGKPLADAYIVVEQGDQKHEAKTDRAGRFEVPFAADMPATVRTWRIEETPGTQDGKQYDSVRYYSTMILSAK